MRDSENSRFLHQRGEGVGCDKYVYNKGSVKLPFLFY